MENLKEKLEKGLLPLYSELFPSLDVEKETAFIMQWGNKFPTEKNTGILFVGKAVNGWAKKEDQSFEKLFAIHDQMKWAENLWNSRKNDDSKTQYLTRRSAFWRVIKGITSSYYEDVDQWYAHIAWSNLYKISPNKSNDGGNPNAKDKGKQLDLCRRILKKEIEILSPKYVIFLTSGWESKSGFLWYINNKQHTEHIEEITWGGNNKIRVYEINDVTFITSVHPQGKNEELHKKNIINLLKKY